MMMHIGRTSWVLHETSDCATELKRGGMVVIDTTVLNAPSSTTFDVTPSNCSLHCDEGRNRNTKFAKTIKQYVRCMVAQSLNMIT